MNCNVPPSGRPDSKYAVIGEAPAREEVKLGKGFVGASGRTLWPLMLRLAGIHRDDCYVSNLFKHPIDNTKITASEFSRARDELLDEIRYSTGCSRILAVGALSSQALLGPQWTNMRACNAMEWKLLDRTVVPCIHPAAAMRSGDDDKLAWSADAISVLRYGRLTPAELHIPDPIVSAYLPPDPGFVAVDTEGTPNDPIGLSWAVDGVRAWVPKEDVPDFWEQLIETQAWAVYHNAIWDWAVISAMGVHEPERHPFHDTMEQAYLLHTEPQGLKDLAWRHLRIKLESFEEVVRPYWEAQVTAAAVVCIEQESTTTLVGKTGRKLKRPRVTRTEFAKSLHRALSNPDLLAKRMDFAPMSLNNVPEDVMIEYATMDAFCTLELFKWWRGAHVTV